MHQTTMKRIAGELGVSITTVSKVLNNRADIGKATRARVLAKVEELGYQPNAVARSLSLRRSNTLGIVIPSLIHSCFVDVIAGIEPVAAARGYAMLLCSSSDDAGKERAQLEMLRSRQADGIVLASAAAAGNTELLQQLAGRDSTLVMIDRDDHPSVHCHRVLSDDEQIGTLAVSHLVDIGRRAIAHITGPPTTNAKRREKGWRDALKTHGIRATDDWLVRGGSTDVDGHRAMKKLLSVRPKLDAVFAASDRLAIGAMKAIWEADRRIPDDIAVVGAGDIALTDMLRVPLTTIGWSRREQGRRAAELLLDTLDGVVERTQRLIIPPRLIVRESSGASR